MRSLDPATVRRWDAELVERGHTRTRLADIFDMYGPDKDPSRAVMEQLIRDALRWSEAVHRWNIGEDARLRHVRLW